MIKGKIRKCKIKKKKKSNFYNFHNKNQHSTIIKESEKRTERKRKTNKKKVFFIITMKIRKIGKIKEYKLKANFNLIAIITLSSW